MIRIDLGSDDVKKGKSKSLFGNLSLGAVRGKSKLPPGANEALGNALGKFKQSVGNLGAVAVLLIAAAAAAVPHVAFLQYRSFVQAEHEARKAELQGKIDAIIKEIGKLTPYQKELESYEKQKSLVKERLEVIRALLAQRGTPVNVLDALGQGLPSRAWLTQLKIDPAAKGVPVTLEGLALNNEDISDYIDKLAESVHLQDVVLDAVTSEKGATTATDYKKFTLAITPKGMKPPPKPVPPPAPVKVAPATPGAPAPGSPAAIAGALRGKEPEIPQ